uniref:FHA domain-containing protein n=1 Tax=Trichobilharzia regenti TaxID=157069 RepID=A0AA85KER9_TRIRE|nr:unnamed protein product [Trichobilharzia regenti]
MRVSGKIQIIRRDGTSGEPCNWHTDKCTIGSKTDSDIRIQHPSVASKHCELHLLDNGQVMAVSRVNEDYIMLVDNIPLEDSCMLSNNSVLTVGERQIRFMYPPGVTINASMPELVKKTPKQLVKDGAQCTPDSLPFVYQPKRTASVNRPATPVTRSPRPRSATPKRTLGTSERYGPVPPRQPATPPIIQVLRHEATSSQSKIQSSLQTPLNRFTKQSSMEKSRFDNFRNTGPCKSEKKDHLKFYTASNFPPLTSSTPGGMCSSTNLRSNQGIHSLVSPTPSANHLKSTVVEKNFSPGLNKILHKQLIVNESSNLSKLGRTDNPGNTSNQIKNQCDISKISLCHGRKNQSYLNEPETFHTAGNPSECLTESVNSTSLRSMKRKLPLNTSKSVNVFSAATDLESDYHGNENGPVIQDENYSSTGKQIAIKRKRGVSFGPPLSPEQFDKSLPPSTPVKRGETPLTKINHITPANATFKTNPDFSSRPLTPFPSKSKSTRSQLSVFSENTFNSPSYYTTSNRISAVISLPPTPDTNLLDSVDTKFTCSPGSYIENPVLTATYSAPVKKSSAYQKALRRRSLNFTGSTEKIPSLRAPPTTPVSMALLSRSTSKANSYVSPFEYESLVLTSPRYRSRQSENPLLLSPNNTKQDDGRTHVLPTQQASNTSTKTNKPRQSTRYSLPLYNKQEIISNKTTKQLTLTTIKNPENASSQRHPQASSKSHSNGQHTETTGTSGHPSFVLNDDNITPNKTLSSVSTADVVGLSGVKKLMKTPKSVYTPRVSGVGDLFVEKSSSKRGRGRPSSVPPEISPDDESATPRKRLSSVSTADVVGLSGVKKLMKTPKSVYTPRVSGVGDLFVEKSSSKRGRGRPSSVPLAIVSDDESATPRKRLSSVSTADVVGLSDVKKLMKTPKSVYTPRVSGVGDLFVEKSSSKRGRGRPSSVPLAIVSDDESATPRKRLSSVSTADVVGLSGVKKLMKTPKSVYTPRVSGVGDLFVEKSSSKRGRGRPSSIPPEISPDDESATPRKRLSSVSTADVVGLSGVKKLMKTPKSVYTPRVSGVGDLFVEKSSSKRGRGRPSSIPPEISPDDESATPRKRLSSVSTADVVGLSDVKKLMKTPKSVYTPRVSGVGDLFVEKSSSKRGRGRPSSIPPEISPDDESATPRKRLSSVSTADVVGLSGVKKLMKTPKSVYTPRVSGVGDLFVEESSSKRGRGRPSSVPPEISPDDESATPRKRLSSVSTADVVGLSDVKKLMKTPKSVYTPRVSGVGDLFVEKSSSKRGRGRPSSIPPEISPDDESATPRKRLSSVSTADVVGLSGVKKLMKTPKSVYTPRVSGVGDLFVEKSSSKRGRGRPSSVPLAIVSDNESATPRKRLSSVSTADVVGLSDVKKLMKTPKSVYTPRVSGVGDLFVEKSSSKRGRGRPSSVPLAIVSDDESATPRKRLSSVSTADVVGLSGVKKLMKTPKSVYTPRVSGVGDLFVEKLSSKRGRGRPSSIPPEISPDDESATPRKRLSSVSTADVVGLSDVKKLMKTPKSVYTPRVSGVGDLFVEESSSKRGRGRPSSVPPEISPDDESATPRKRLSSVSTADVVGLSDVKKLMKTPKSVYTPRVSGVGDLFVEESSSKRGRGRPSSVPPEISPDDESATPRKRLSSVSTADVVGLSDVKKLMKTPKSVYTPRVSGVGDLFVEKSSSKRGSGRPSSIPPEISPDDESATPRKRLSSVSTADVVGLSGVKKLMKTPKSVYTPRVSGVGDLFVEKSSSKRGRGRPSSIPPEISPDDESATPRKRLSSVSTADVVGLSDVKKLMKTPKSVYTPRVSGVGDLFVEESSSKRGRGRPSSVPPEISPDDESATPRKRLSSVSTADVVGLSGVKKLMKTPKSVYTPRVSGVGDLFVEKSSSKRGRGRPSSVPLAIVSDDESATPRKRLSSVSTADVVGLSDVKKLMKTPKSVYTPRVSGVGDLFVEKSSSKRGRGRPSSVPPEISPDDESATPRKRLSSVSTADVVGLSDVKKLMKTPKSVYTPRVSGVGDLFVEKLSSKRGRGRPSSIPPEISPDDESATPRKRLSSVSTADVVGLSDVKKLMKTPKSVYTPRVSGVGDLFVEKSSSKRGRGRPSSIPPEISPDDESATPRKRLSSVSTADVVGLSGVKKLMKTPKSVYTPRVSGVGDLFVEKSSSKRGRGRPSSIPPEISPDDESATPRKRLSSVSTADVVGLSDVKKLMKTPKSVYTPRVSGVGDLFVEKSSSKRGRGRPSSIPPEISPDDESATPRKRLSSVSTADVVGLSGVKKLMKTPKSVYTPRVSGVGDLFVEKSSSKRGRGRPSSVPPEISPDDESATPRKRLSSVSTADVVGLSDVKKLMKTPKSVYTPRVSGVGDLFVEKSSSKRGRGRPSSVPLAIVSDNESATPRKRLSSVSTADVVGLSDVKKLMKTPKSVYTPRVSGVGDLFVEKSSSKRGRGRPSSVPLAIVSDDESATPRKRLSSVSTADVVGLSGVKKLMKTPKSVYTPRVSGVGDLFVEKSSSKRGRGRPSSVPPEISPDDESATPRKRLSSVSTGDVGNVTRKSDAMSKAFGGKRKPETNSAVVVNVGEKAPNERTESPAERVTRKRNVEANNEVRVNEGRRIPTDRTESPAKRVTRRLKLETDSEMRRNEGQKMPTDRAESPAKRVTRRRKVETNSAVVVSEGEKTLTERTESPAKRVTRKRNVEANNEVRFNEGEKIPTDTTESPAKRVTRKRNVEANNEVRVNEGQKIPTDTTESPAKRVTRRRKVETNSAVVVSEGEKTPTERTESPAKRVTRKRNVEANNEVRFNEGEKIPTDTTESPAKRVTRRRKVETNSEMRVNEGQKMPTDRTESPAKRVTRRRKVETNSAVVVSEGEKTPTERTESPAKRVTRKRNVEANNEVRFNEGEKIPTDTTESPAKRVTRKRNVEANNEVRFNEGEKIPTDTTESPAKRITRKRKVETNSAVAVNKKQRKLPDTAKSPTAVRITRSRS